MKLGTEVGLGAGDMTVVMVGGDLISTQRQRQQPHVTHQATAAVHKFRSDLRSQRHSSSRSRRSCFFELVRQLRSLRSSTTAVKYSGQTAVLRAAAFQTSCSFFSPSRIPYRAGCYSSPTNACTSVLHSGCSAVSYSTAVVDDLSERSWRTSVAETERENETETYSTAAAKKYTLVHAFVGLL